VKNCVPIVATCLFIGAACIQACGSSESRTDQTAAGSGGRDAGNDAGGGGGGATAGTGGSAAMGGAAGKGGGGTGGSHTAGSAGTGNAGSAGTDSAGSGGAAPIALRPIWLWIWYPWQLDTLASKRFVAAASIYYDGPFDAAIEAGKGWRWMWDSTSTLDFAVNSLKPQYDQGARHLFTDIEQWPPLPKNNRADAERLCQTIQSMPGLEVMQSNASSSWEADALPILEHCQGLLLGEMIYPTAYNNTTFEELRGDIIASNNHYVDNKPAIGLTVYTDQDNMNPVSWELMKTQIDAARAAGQSWGSPLHPIAIFWPPPATDRGQPTEFTMDDVVCYIVLHDLNPPEHCP
jgi:hypothetical protein